MRALSDISLQFSPGRIYGIVGQNGSGKSTLLRHIAGLVRPDEGEMRLFGAPFAPREPADADKRGIFSVLGLSDVIDTLSVAENTLRNNYPRTALGFINWKELYRRAAELYASLNVPMDVFAEAGALCPKDRRIVAIARAYYAHARILLLDEPDFSPADQSYPAVLAMLRAIAQDGGCVLITTHRLNTLPDLADHIFVLENGELRFSGSKDTLSRDELLAIVSGKHTERPDIYPRLDAAKGPPLLRLENISTNDVSNLNLQIYKGEILGICALRPERRTAVSRLLYGLEHIQSGKVTLLGQPISLRSPADALKYGIGRLQEDRAESGLQTEFPIAPNISLGNLKAFRRMGLFRRGREEHAARSYVRRLNIRTASMREKVSELSMGNQQKVLFSRLLCANCRILLLEEPTQNLDKPSKNEVYNFMSSFVRKGGAIVLASSHIDELMGMCDRIVIFNTSGGYVTQGREDFDKEAILSCSL